MKKTIQDSKIRETLISIDQKIRASHQDEKLHDEQVAVTKIKDDPHFFFRYAKKSSICGSNIGPLLDPATNCVTDDKFLMCKLLVDQFNSVFTTPDQSKIVIDPELFFSVDENSVNESPHLTLSDPGYFRQLTIRGGGGGGGFKSPPPLQSRKLLCQSSPYHTCGFYQVFLA